MRHRKAVLSTSMAASLVVVLGAGCAATDEPSSGAPDPTEDQGIDPSQLVDYVHTPAGLYHKSCVPEIEDGASVDEHLLVTRADGTTYQLPDCQYPHYRLDSQGMAHSTEVLEPTVHGWVENGYRYNGTGYKQFNADWYVPASPTTNGGLVYFFPGFEPDDYSRIIQPVLQWGYNGDFGGNMWTFASWSCASGSCPHSTPHQTWPNHHIYGKITGSSCSGGICYFNISTTDGTTGQTTNLGWQAHVLYTRGYAALEAYGIDTCSKYPSGPRVWMNTSVWRTDGSLATASWSAQYSSVSPGCSQYVDPYGDSAVGLYWSH
jgi:hypothetical protein